MGTDLGCQEQNKRRWETKEARGVFRQGFSGMCPGGEIAHSGTGKMEHAVEGLEYFLKSVPMSGSQ